jgi:hypothetical protein
MTTRATLRERSERRKDGTKVMIHRSTQMNTDKKFKMIADESA